MSFSVFRIQPGKLFVKDYASCPHCHTLMTKLNQFAYKVEHQDDLFCLLGSTLTDDITHECIDIVASVFVSRFTELVNNKTELQALLNAINIRIAYDARGYWRPSANYGDRVVFIQQRHRMAQSA